MEARSPSALLSLTAGRSLEDMRNSSPPYFPSCRRDAVSPQIVFRFFKRVVSKGMTKCVVHIFEVVNIRQDDADGLMASLGPVEFATEGVEDFASIQMPVKESWLRRNA